MDIQNEWLPTYIMRLYICTYEKMRNTRDTSLIKTTDFFPVKECSTNARVVLCFSMYGKKRVCLIAEKSFYSEGWAKKVGSVPSHAASFSN